MGSCPWWNVTAEHTMVTYCCTESTSQYSRYPLPNLPYAHTRGQAAIRFAEALRTPFRDRTRTTFAHNFEDENFNILTSVSTMKEAVLGISADVI